MDEKVGRGDKADFIRGTPSNYEGRTFTAKPRENVESVKENNVED